MVILFKSNQDRLRQDNYYKCIGFPTNNTLRKRFLKCEILIRFPKQFMAGNFENYPNFNFPMMI